MDVYGTGNEEQIFSAKQLAAELGIEKQIVWHGNQPNRIVMDAMRKTQVFFFTSISEDTSTVVLEAISNRLPVLCFNACGMAAVIDKKVGQTVELSNPQQSIYDFATTLNCFEKDRNLLKECSQNCKTRQQELSWENKAKQMVELYQKTIEQYDQKK